MKQTEAQSVGEIIQHVIEAEGQTDNFDRQNLCYLWSDVVGPVFNQATVRRYIDGDVLHVYLTSASMKQELAYTADSLVEKLNEAIGKHIIRKIVFH
jgi:hypothetical protein